MLQNLSITPIMSPLFRLLSAWSAFGSTMKFDIPEKHKRMLQIELICSAIVFCAWLMGMLPLSILERWIASLFQPSNNKYT
ncbi:MAG: hypothetical protein BWK74_01245 [Desulfobacteraceae bacterium A6]|nr:MAG: hypothetical protein BWK74_01245 [Desulfobacteraceae bacterium A6]